MTHTKMLESFFPAGFAMGVVLLSGDGAIGVSA
jgi:hypothetical protein